MKKRMTMAILLAPALLFAQKGEFTIKGKVGETDAPKKIFLDLHNGDQVTTDSVVLNKGSFEFKGRVPQPLKAWIYFKGGTDKDQVFLYVEKGKITVTGDGYLSKATISGSVTSDYVKKYFAKINAISTNSDNYYQQLKQAQMDFIKENPDTFVNLVVFNLLLKSSPQYEELEPLFSIMSAEAKASKEGQECAASLLKLKQK
jgi:hypothetical protein